MVVYYVLPKSMEKTDPPGPDHRLLVLVVVADGVLDDVQLVAELAVAGLRQAEAAAVTADARSADVLTEPEKIQCIKPVRKFEFPATFDVIVIERRSSGELSQNVTISL